MSSSKAEKSSKYHMTREGLASKRKFCQWKFFLFGSVWTKQVKVGALNPGVKPI
jgi:hypothetical protein